MIKIKPAKLNSREFITAIQNLMRKQLSFGTAFKLKTLAKKLDKAGQEATQLYLEIIKKHVELDENGNIKPDSFKEDIKHPNGEVQFKAGDSIPNSYVVKEGEEDNLKKEVEDYMSTEIEVDAHPISYESLCEVDMSGHEIDLLEEVIYIPEEIANNVVKLK